MVKSKKLSKSSLAVIVLSLLLILSMIVGMTAAWFTDKKENSGVTKNFGTVALSVDDSSFGKVTRVSNENGDVTGFVMPGDTINYTLGVTKAEDSEDFWYAVLVTITGTEANQSPAQSAIKETDVHDVASEKSVTGTLELTGASYGNTYQGKAITLSYTVVAVQKANVADKATAATLLQSAVARS